MKISSIAGCARARLSLIGLAVLLAAGSLPSTADARSRALRSRAPASSWAAPVASSIVVDGETGQVISENNADAVTYPASLTKMMTLYLTFEAMNSGKLRLDTQFPVSEEAASKAPSKLGLVPGDSISVRDLILGIVTKSANDAAAVLAEGVGGSEGAFAERMTQKARQLGMDSTRYHNASGLPDPEQRTTARDVAQLAIALYHDFPREYRYFSTPEFVFRGNIFPNHNHFMRWYEGADGLKTGFIRASGFNLAASAVRNGRRMIGVVMGGSTGRERDRHMGAIMDSAFAATAGSATLVARRDPPVAAPRREIVEAADVDEESDVPPAKVARVATQAMAPQLPAQAIQPARGEPRFERTRAPDTLIPSAPARNAARNADSADRYSIQLGAFRAVGAAERVAVAAADLASTRGRQMQIMEPVRGEKMPVYRPRIMNFSARDAQNACAALRKRGIDCSVVPPGALKVASR